MYLKEFAPPFEGPREGHFVGVFEIAPHGQPEGDLGDFDEGFYQLADVEGGGFAFDAGADGEDDFGDVGFAGAADQGLNAELVGADAVHGGDDAAEHMVAAAIFAGFFQGNYITGIGNNAESMGVTGAIAAN